MGRGGFLKKMGFTCEEGGRDTFSCYVRLILSRVWVGGGLEVLSWAIVCG